MPPKVSVVIPTYNRSKLLKKTLQSVLDQTYRDYEILVVNNSSTDDTKEMIESFEDPRIRVLDIQNQGVIAKSRNLGMRNAQGEYIAFLDDDDLWLPEKLEKQVDYLEKHTEYDLVYAPVWTIDENDVRKEYLEIKRDPAEGRIFYELVRGNYISTLTVMMRRPLLSDIGFFSEDPALRSIEDYDYWLRIALKKQIGFIDEPLALYRVHSSGVSKTVNESRLNQKVLKSFEDSPDVAGKDRIVARIYGLYCKSAIYNWRNGNRGEAKKDLGEYFRWSAKNRRIANVIKASALYLALATGFYKILLKYPKRFRMLFCHAFRAMFRTFLLHSFDVTAFLRTDAGTNNTKKLRNVYAAFFSENIFGRYFNRTRNMSLNICLFWESDMPSPLLSADTRYSGMLDR
jgi:glycosyltransferase involved in cell wall biosynthesis